MAAAAAYCAGEEEVWKCPKHPAKRRCNGICATCLRDRLDILCPHCAQVRPCPCVFNSTSSSSVAGESSLRRTRSLAIPFLRSSNNDDQDRSRSKTPSFLSVFRRSNTKRISESADDKGKGKAKATDANDEVQNPDDISHHRIEDFAKLITRSRSVRQQRLVGADRGTRPPQPGARALKPARPLQPGGFQASAVVPAPPHHHSTTAHHLFH